MYDLSILIPARNEMFLRRTVEDIFEHIEGKTEVIVVLDGEWADPGLMQDPRLTVIHNPVSVGQRAATNQAAKLSKAKYVMKVDAHCSFGQGFDRIMMEDMRDDWTLIPMMKNLHAFDWVCEKCGNRWYQSPSPEYCRKHYDDKERARNEACDSKDFRREVMWIAKKAPNSVAFCVDKTLHFQYFNEFKGRPECQDDLNETLTIQGSCFMLTREKYWELDICDENFGSWGQQGVEVAFKTWFSGGTVMCTKKTYYAHLFRTQGGDFGFPYPNPEPAIERARQISRDMFLEGKWPGMVKGRNFEWLLKRFYPVPYWHMT